MTIFLTVTLCNKRIILRKGSFPSINLNFGKERKRWELFPIEQVWCRNKGHFILPFFFFLILPLSNLILEKKKQHCPFQCCILHLLSGGRVTDSSKGAIPFQDEVWGAWAAKGECLPSQPPIPNAGKQRPYVGTAGRQDPPCPRQPKAAAAHRRAELPAREQLWGLDTQHKTGGFQQAPHVSPTHWLKVLFDRQQHSTPLKRGVCLYKSYWYPGSPKHRGYPPNQKYNSSQPTVTRLPDVQNLSSKWNRSNDTKFD